MTTYLAIKGQKFGDILLDTVDEQGATLKHLTFCETKTDAYVKASRIIANRPETLAMLGLQPGNYRLVD